MIVDIKKEEFEHEVVDVKHNFRLVYVPSLNIHLMICTVYWIATYERYYSISKEDYELYLSDNKAYYKKYEREIMQKGDCFTEHFIGAAALRDYDGANGFQMAYPPADGEVNPFQHHVFIDGIFYARIVWKDEEICVPPVQAVLLRDGSYNFPLRKKCQYQLDATGQPICYRLKTEED